MPALELTPSPPTAGVGNLNATTDLRTALGALPPPPAAADFMVTAFSERSPPLPPLTADARQLPLQALPPPSAVEALPEPQAKAAPGEANSDSSDPQPEQPTDLGASLDGQVLDVVEAVSGEFSDEGLLSGDEEGQLLAGDDLEPGSPAPAFSLARWANEQAATNWRLMMAFCASVAAGKFWSDETNTRQTLGGWSALRCACCCACSFQPMPCLLLTCCSTRRGAAALAVPV